MSFRKYIRRNIYKWHRVTSLLVAVPVLLWTISGFLHPVMGALKPEVKNSRLPATTIDTSAITISLKEALQQNGIDSLQNFRIVKLYRGFYFQVWQKGLDSLTYLNCESGNVLTNGDQHYAAYLAQRYLWEENGTGKNDNHDHGKLTASLSSGASVDVRSGPVKPNTKVVSTKRLTKFTDHYKASNKLLPVYEVAFNREDSIRLYIDTKADRLSLASDEKKRWFTNFFSLTHSWSFLNGLGKTKAVLLGTFSLLCLLSSVFGFAVYNIMKPKKKSSTQSKRWHRVLGNIFLLTTLLYAFSGAWHAFAKLPARALLSLEKQNISSADVDLNLQELLTNLSPDEKLSNVSVAQVNGELYWQVVYKKEKTVAKKYIATKTGAVLKNGDAAYAASLAAAFKGAEQADIVATSAVSSFNHRYSMMNKRLPVVENKFEDGDAVFVETATGEIAALTKPADEAERFSFSNLHMHHYWEMWLGKAAGKAAKNTVLIASTLGLLLLALTGIIIYLRKRFLNAKKASQIS
ncbi:MAG TPA: PepSY domain-containing protein [Flavisolibacter sp.]|nr:PepSY domain-containing protein [Flavisolibacter sp.]